MGIIFRSKNQGKTICVSKKKNQLIQKDFNFLYLAP
jgi:hypothetical protein